MNLPTEYIADALNGAKFPAVFTSFGKDSLLLLTLAHAVRRDSTLYHFGPLSEFAQKYIMDNELTVFSYAPADRYLVETDTGLALIDEYAVNDSRVPVVREIIEGGGCAHGLPSQRTAAFRLPNDLVLWGYKQIDDVPAIGVTLDKEVTVGSTRFIAPLYEMTDADVYEALETLEITSPPEDDGVEFCNDCLESLDRDGCRQNLDYFRQRFSFH